MVTLASNLGYNNYSGKVIITSYAYDFWHASFGLQQCLTAKAHGKVCQMVAQQEAICKDYEKACSLGRGHSA